LAESTIEKTPESAEPTPAVEIRATQGVLHLSALDGIRGLAALYVLLHHVTTDLPYGNINPIQRVLGFAFKFGHYPVDVFIVLSGYCLMIPVCRAGGILRGGAKTFFIRRAKRILPTYYAALAFSLVLIWLFLGTTTGTHWDEALPVTTKDIWTHLLLLQDLFPKINHDINYAMWSISVEWRIYFLFPLMVLAAARFGAPIVAAVTCVASYVLLALLRHTPINTDPWGVSPAYFGLFSLGMLACDMSFGKLRDHWQKPGLFVASLAVLSVTGVGLSVSPFYAHLQALSLVVGLWAACLMLCVMRGYLPWANRVFSWKPVAFLGTIGYSLYLFHPPLIQIAWTGLIRPFGFSHTAQQLLLFACTPLIVGGCYLAFLLFERPVLRWLAAKK
jgi:peptidoglycan/LPS O-acetylase OafA/YrhL